MPICSTTLNLPGWLGQHGYILNRYQLSVRYVHTWVLFRQPLHSYVWVLVLAIAIIPQRLQTWTWYGSDASNSLSLKNWAAPWAIWQSRSISPKRRPPSLSWKKQQTILYWFSIIIKNIRKKETRLRFFYSCILSTWWGGWEVYQLFGVH